LPVRLLLPTVSLRLCRPAIGLTLLLPALPLIACAGVAARTALIAATARVAVRAPGPLFAATAPSIFPTLSVSRSNAAQNRCGHKSRQHQILQHHLRFQKGHHAPHIAAL
jgi:hypothetical protein